jgi:predicted GIY-YIG superfamily endonuclease
VKICFIFIIYLTSMSKYKSLSVYVLKLKNQKWYIGSSENVEERIKEHYNEAGSEWTKKYPPIRTIEIKHNCNALEEDYITKQYMNQYGIKNVRGGSYCKMILTDAQTESLATEMKTAHNECFRCGEQGHFSNTCQVYQIDQQSDSSSNDEISDEKSDSSSNDEISDEEAYEDAINGITGPIYVYEESIIVCYRCGRKGHIKRNCYARCHVNGHYLL